MSRVCFRKSIFFPRSGEIQSPLNEFKSLLQYSVSAERKEVMLPWWPLKQRCESPVLVEELTWETYSLTASRISSRLKAYVQIMFISQVSTWDLNIVFSPSTNQTVRTQLTRELLHVGTEILGPIPSHKEHLRGPINITVNILQFRLRKTLLITVLQMTIKSIKKIKAESVWNENTLWWLSSNISWSFIFFKIDFLP